MRITHKAGTPVAGGAAYLHADQLGSVRTITSAAGASAKQTIYRLFGETVEHITDASSAPALGMFIQPDWFEVTMVGVGTNRYAYSFNDPVNLRDPGGNVAGNWESGDPELDKEVNCSACGAVVDDGLEDTYSRAYMAGEVPAHPSYTDSEYFDKQQAALDNSGKALAGALGVSGALDAAIGVANGDCSAAVLGVGEVALGKARAIKNSTLYAGDTIQYIYRSIHKKHPQYENALNGKVIPGNVNGNISPDLHNEGGYSRTSPYTSWTHKPEIANRYAGKDGVVVRVPTGAPKAGDSWSWHWSPDVYHES